jgi:hypothetical protein
MTVRCCFILNPDFSMMFQRRLILNLEPAILEDVSLLVDLES